MTQNEVDAKGLQAQALQGAWSKANYTATKRKSLGGHYISVATVNAPYAIVIVIRSYLSC
jgi:hypothetical protein